MEKYIVNGIEVEYDTFDLDNMELFDSESKRVVELIKNELSSKSDINKLRKYADVVRDFFDTVVGEGTAEKVFGPKDNIRAIRNGYMEFFNSVISACDAMNHECDKENVENREQQRAADRQKRREEASKRAAVKSVET